MTDLISTVSGAIELAVRLKKIGENIKEAEFKNLLADLSSELAEAKLKAASLMEENAKLREQLLKSQGTQEESCPKCRKPTFEMVSSRPHPVFGDSGFVERQHKCSACGFQEAKTVET